MSSVGTEAMRNMALSEAQKVAMLDAGHYSEIAGDPRVIRKLVELKLAENVREYGRCAMLTEQGRKMLPPEHRARKMHERLRGDR